MSQTVPAGGAHRRTDVLAWIIWLAAAASLGAAFLIIAAPDSDAVRAGDAFLSFAFMFIVPLFATVGAAIATRRPDHYAGWAILLMGFALGLSLFCAVYGNIGLTSTPFKPFADYASWIALWSFGAILGLFATLFPLYFPTGRSPGRRWRWVAWLAVASVLLIVVGEAFQPGAMGDDPPFVPNPVGAPVELAGLLATLEELGNIGLILAVILTGASVVVRYRRADRTEALQIKWFAFVAVGLAVAFPIASLNLGPISDVCFALGFVFLGALPVAIAFAVLRYRLLEIDRLISRTIVFGALTAILAGLYAASLRLFQGLFVAFTGNESDAALVITTLILATTLTPLKTRLEAFAARHVGEEAGKTEPTTIEPARGLSLDDPGDVAALEAIIARVVRRELGRS